MIAILGPGSKPQAIEAEALEERVSSLAGVASPPFTPELVGVLDEISRRIFRHPHLRHAPQYVALAYWLRRSSIHRQIEAIAGYQVQGQVATARGVALHLPPTNVDTIFVYSWALALLAGNTNVVRLPTNLKSETRLLVGLLIEALADLGEENRHIFCHYPYGQAIETALARHFDLRLIWGGDAKVAQVSKVSIRPDGLSIGFPDRKSVTVIASNAYAASDDAGRNSVCEGFFNDVFWFDQMGCGSPRLIIWLGEPGSAASDFYRRVAQRAKDYRVEAGTSIAKFALAHDLLADAITSQHYAYTNALNVSRAIDPVEAMLRPHGAGFICEWVCNDIEAIRILATRSLQTVTHFGLNPQMVEQLANVLRGGGGYRVVPVGQALQFEPVWDGVDLMRHMTRVIVWR
jgi:hypothetical protein